MTDPDWDAEQEHPTLRSDLAVYPLDEDLVVFDPRSGQSFVLNATGRVVWALCDGERSQQVIAEELASVFEVPIDRAKADVMELLDQFRKSNLLLRG